MNCAPCGKKTCDDGEMCTEIDMEFFKNYSAEETGKIFKNSSDVEAEGYMKLTRIEEIVLFSKKMNYKRLGIAFCIGLEEEAKILYKILKKHFRVSSICCKVCGISKDEMKIQKIVDGRFEAICNPVAQAELLKEEKTDLNIICGLCVGHDMLFTKYSAAPVTTLIVKDRVLGHNPVSALYSNYYKKMLLEK
ncbi:DUF1847 domain-containing protein [candidate division KSB1 bacterium]